MGLNYCPSLPPFGFTALTLECFCNQYVELKKGVFKFKWMMLLSTRCYLSKKKKKKIILHHTLIFMEPSQKKI